MLLLAPLAMQAQHERGNWSIEIGMGSNCFDSDEGKMKTQDWNSDQNEGNTAFVQGEYLLNKHDALTAGLFYEQHSFFGYYTNSDAPFKYNLGGISGGIRHYFFHNRWIIQPYIGAQAYFNFFNDSHRTGKRIINADAPNGQATIDYSVKAPFLSLGPQLGVDIHILRSISLTFAYDYRFGLNGSNYVSGQFTSGRMAGTRIDVADNNIRHNVQIGIKVDFPFRTVSDNTRNTLIDLLIHMFAGR